MATLTIPDQTLMRLEAAAAARRVPLGTYLEEIASKDVATEVESVATAKLQNRIAAGESIRKLAAEIKHKASIEELIGDKRSGHKH